MSLTLFKSCNSKAKPFLHHKIDQRKQSTAAPLTRNTRKQTNMLARKVCAGSPVGGADCGRGAGPCQEGWGYLHHGARRPTLWSSTVHLLGLQDYPLKHFHSGLKTHQTQMSETHSFIPQCHHTQKTEVCLCFQSTGQTEVGNNHKGY